MKFITFLIKWVAGNLAIPFWVVGHIHLSIHTFHSLLELTSSIAMNIIVAVGFFIDYNNDRTKDSEKKN